MNSRFPNNNKPPVRIALTNHLQKTINGLTEIRTNGHIVVFEWHGLTQITLEFDDMFETVDVLFSNGSRVAHGVRSLDYDAVVKTVTKRGCVR